MRKHPFSWKLHNEHPGESWIVLGTKEQAELG
jgi:hypothetical protein